MGGGESQALSTSSTETLPFSENNILLINGNRALYKSAVWRKGNAHWAYVQHSSYEDRQGGGLRNFIRHILLRLLMLRVDAVVRVSRSALPDSWGRNKLVTIYNGIRLKDFPVKTSWRKSLNEPFSILMVGAINNNKNQKLAIDALIHLPSARLKLVGEGPDLSRLKEHASLKGVSDRVEWLGHRMDTSVFYREADVYLMLSRFEAMPFVILEAMASGTPVVGFPVGGVGEVIEHGTDGVLLADRNPEALAAALLALECNPEQVRSMGQRARRKIEGQFTDERMADEFERVFDQLMASEKGKVL